MPPVTVPEPQQPSNTPSVPEPVPPKQSIGIIYPPPELRNIVDKTASFVARNGPEFEARIRQNEINNPKFNFLNAGDPYNAYYQHRVKEFKEGKGQEPTAQPTLSKPSVVQKPEISKIVEQPIIPKEPPPEYEFVYDPPSISAYDLDLVKLTAQFVARNGRQFLINLMNREQRNSQFDFLRPQHSLCKYFLKLFEQYTKILIPPKDLTSQLKKESDMSKGVFEQVRYRVEWTKQQEAQKRREAEEAERERVQYAQIDWHDFVVVETVDYQPNEQGLFPPPTTPDEVGSRVLAQKRIEEEGEEVEMEVDSDEGSDAEETQAKEGSDDEGEGDDRPPSPPPLPPKEAPPQPPPLPPQPDQVVVRKDYNPKVSKTQPPMSEQYLVSPITGERIPADKMQEHMRIGLLDPRWVEQRDRSIQEKMVQEEVYAVGSAIESSLKQFAERRTDIFGFGDEEAAIGKKIGEEERKRPEKVTWDGHTASMEAATRAARANITIEEQIQQIHKIKGLLPDEEKERIGPSKPQAPVIVVTTQPAGLPPAPPTSTGASTSGTATTTQHTTVTKPPMPTMTLITTTMTPNPAPPVQRPPLPPLPPPPQMPPPPVHGLMHQPQPLMGHPPGLMMTPLGPPGPPMQPLLAMQPHLGPPMPSPFGGPVPPMAPPPQMGQPHEMNFTGEDEPPNKRLKAEDQLVPESEFLKKNKSPVNFKVQVPKISDKSEWKLNGQFINVILPLTDMVSVMKSKIHEETGMPPGKQKLQLEGLFLKDSNTLAYYNMTPGRVVSLQLKERGGRKK